LIQRNDELWVGARRNCGWKEKLERFWRSSFQGLSLAPNEELAIDLGAANTRVFLPGEGVVVNEPSMIALNTESNKIAAVGQEARALARRQPREIRVARPVKDGVIADCEAAGQMLSQFISRVLTHRGPASLSLLICVPADITPLEQRAYENAAGRAGAGKVTPVEEPYAAAIGARLNLRAARACMIVDLGAATTDVAVISGGGMLHASTRRVGGSEIDRSIARYLQLERALEVSEETAEEIKIKLGGVNTLRDSRPMAVRGRNLRTGLPEEITVSSEEIHPLIQPALRVIKQHVRAALGEIPTEASVDLLDSGITLSGGLAQLPGLAEDIHQELGLSVRVAPDPMLSAALGAGRLLEQESHVSTQEAMKEQESAGWRASS
jgi:rod shape-determining protein MreB and related proteins